MQAYVVQSAAGMVKLDAMENPFPLPERLRAELGKRLGEVEVNRYPGSRVADLKAMLASSLDLNDSQAIVLGNGSDELISLLVLACSRTGASILAPVPGFVMYELSARLMGLAFHGVPLTADFELDVPAMSVAIAEHQPAVTFLAYPNNPTANLWGEDAVRTVVRAVGAYGGIVVIDEAYQPFASKSWLSQIRTNPGDNRHVLLMRTMSKQGLAGARLGYMLGDAELIAQIDKVRPPYNVSSLNAECGLFALEHAQALADQAATVREERDRLLAALAAISGVKPFPSEANMVLVRVPDAAKTFAELKQRGILVKNVSTMHSLLGNCLRLTVGTPQENAILVDALKQSL
ncbi:histidinol-phosphate transaminase [Hydrogenophaga sp. 5NK40-0174]|uniref:histidinol-phosphate transaminase n=1 Tax=Hydrogenophaga sp. 5NK40-0174 TaxID=3127649 RepID=UPI00334117F3